MRGKKGPFSMLFRRKEVWVELSDVCMSVCLSSKVLMLHCLCSTNYNHFESLYLFTSYVAVC